VERGYRDGLPVGQRELTHHINLVRIERIRVGRVEMKCHLELPELRHWLARELNIADAKRIGRRAVAVAHGTHGFQHTRQRGSATCETAACGLHRQDEHD
jgi:hypothetical protein